MSNKKYFEDKVKEVSNTYMSANGGDYHPCQNGGKCKCGGKCKKGYSNASGFFGSGVSTFQVMWWSLGTVVVLWAISKGVKTYRQIKK